MNTKSLSLIAVVALAACTSAGVKNASDSAAKTASKSAAKSGLLLENMDLSVKPGDDFAMHVNGNWLRNTEIPADKASYGVGFMLHETAQENVKAIIEESAAGNFPDGSPEQKVGDLYYSYMDSATREARGVTPLAPEFKTIDGLGNQTDLARYFAHANIQGYNAPFGMPLFPDLKRPTHYALYSWQGGLGLPDREYYFNADEKSQQIRVAYVEHIEKMLTLAGLHGGAAAAQEIMELETRLAAEHMKKEQTRDIVALYNMYPVADLAGLMPGFAWGEYFKTAGVPDTEQLVVTQVEYMKALNGILTSTPLATWKTFLKWGVINAKAGALNAALDQQNFEFYRKTLTGAQEQLPQWRRAVNVVNGTLGEVVGKVYVKRHFPPAAKDHMLRLVDGLLGAYEVSIKELDWMSDETRVQALDKLAKFTPKIGYPDIWKDYTALAIRRGDLYGNLERSAAVEYQRNIDKLAGPVLKHEWQMTPQTVNAYYNPPQNEIVFPAAILQPPYFDLTADDAVNYGGVGAIIGHEIGHGFDDAGSTFDGDGVLRNWWTDADKSAFKARTEKLVAQYDEFQVFDDLNVNGTFTLGENIGDLGGLSIALQAYKASLNGAAAPVIDGYTGEQRVFLGWAQSWLRKTRDEELRRRISTDPHSPARFRVNGVVRNIPEFYAAFDVQPGDALYLPPEDRVKIW